MITDKKAFLGQYKSYYKGIYKSVLSESHSQGQQEFFRYLNAPCLNEIDKAGCEGLLTNSESKNTNIRGHDEQKVTISIEFS